MTRRSIMPPLLRSAVRWAAIATYAVTIPLCALMAFGLGLGEPAAGGEEQVVGRWAAVGSATAVGLLLTWRLWLNVRVEALAPPKVRRAPRG